MTDDEEGEVKGRSRASEDRGRPEQVFHIIY